MIRSGVNRSTICRAQRRISDNKSSRERRRRAVSVFPLDLRGVPMSAFYKTRRSPTSSYSKAPLYWLSFRIFSALFLVASVVAFWAAVRRAC